MNLPAIIFILILFSILMVFFSQDKVDYFPVALLLGAIGVATMISLGGLSELEVLGFINFKTLIFIFAMQIIIFFATNDKVLEYLAINVIHLTKGNNRLMFWVICLFTGTIVAFIEDLTLSLILVPLIYRTCRALKIPAGTYMMGMTISINIGAILTPVSSLKNLIIGQEFNWGFGQYFVNMGILFIVTLLLTIFLLDRFILSKEKPPTEEMKGVLLKLLDPDLVVANKRNFRLTFLVFVSTFVFLVLGFEPALVVLISASILLILHWKECKFADLKKELPLRIIVTFAVLFIFSNSLSAFGFSELVSNGLTTIINDNIFLAVLLTLLISSLLSAFLAGTPVTIILLPIFSKIVGSSVFPNPIIIAFISGVNLAGNFLPQGSACDMLTLFLAKKYMVKNLNYKRLLKNGAAFATFHFLLVLGYTMVYALIVSYI